MMKSTIRNVMGFLLLVVLILVITCKGEDKTVYADTFSFAGGSGSFTNDTPSTATWTENGYTLKLSITGAEAIYTPAETWGAYSLAGLAIVNSSSTDPISVTISIDGGYVFDLAAIKVYDPWNYGDSSTNTYTITTPRGGNTAVVPDSQTTCSGSQFQGISSFTIAVTGNSGFQTGVIFSDLTLNNITKAPTVSNISPSAGPIDGGTTVIITGTNFTGATAVKFGSTNAASYTVNSSTQITATAPAGTAGTVDITVTTAGGTSTTGASSRFTYMLAPTVSNISPSAGPTTGGTTVTITGTNLMGVSAVKFGGKNASGYTVVSLTQITATAPAGTAGTVDITVTSAGGTSATSANDQFTYIAAPTVSNISPSAGPAAGGTEVIITGTNLMGASVVKFGSMNATSFTVDSATQITATSPAGTAGTVDITVTTAGGTSTTGASSQFTYVAAPTISNISPSAGPIDGGTTVIITGTNFTGATAVKFGSTDATNYTVVSPTQITATAPAGTAGTVDITVTTAGGTSTTGASSQFTYMLAPTVSNISPSAGPAAGGTAVIITGTNLMGASVVKFGGKNASGFTVNSPTQIIATAPAGTAGTVDITVTSAGGTSTTGASSQFTYVAAPTISNISPSSGPIAGGTTVIITGTNLMGASAVKFGSTNAASFIVDSATQITATSPAGTAGTVDITVTTAGGTSTTGANDQFTYVEAPTVNIISPSAGPTTGGTAVIITGTNLGGATSVRFGSTDATNYIVDSANLIIATAPAGTAGTVDIKVTTAGGTSATRASSQFTYAEAPTVSNISPSVGPTTGGTAVIITGTNLGGATSVRFGSTDATSFTVDSATQITATSPAGTAGTVDITVTTAGGTSTTGANDQFTYVAAPTVSNISPSAGPTTGGTAVIITGTNLMGASAVKFGSTNATSFTVDSATQITATAPAGTAGTVDITVTTAGGTSTTGASSQFTYKLIPTVSGISPSSGPIAGGTSVIITGTNFTGASAVKFGSTNATSYTVDSATQITAAAPAGTAGTVDITVTTTEGTSATGSSGRFTYVAPPSGGGNSGSTGIEDGEGLITKDHQKDVNAPDTNLNNSTDELKGAIFTTEELSRIAAGEEAKIILKISDISNSVSEDDKKLIAEKLTEDVSVIYIDLSLYKKIGSQSETKITETNHKISISIEIPVELHSTDMTKNRTYKIVRIHDGKASILEGSYDPTTNIITFETDRFSVYALTYEEANTDMNTGVDENKVTVTKDFFTLRLRTKATANSQKLTYNQISGADGYVIYGAPCGTNNKLVKLADVSGEITSYTHKYLKKGTYYKYQVKAYKIINGKKVVIAVSKVNHSVTISKSLDNPTKVEVNTSAVTLTLGKTKKVNCQVILPKGKKMSNHTAAIQFETSNKDIATVDSSGKIKGVAKGTCYIYAYAQNGVYKKIKVTVK